MRAIEQPVVQFMLEGIDALERDLEAEGISSPTAEAAFAAIREIVTEERPRGSYRETLGMILSLLLSARGAFLLMNRPDLGTRAFDVFRGSFFRLAALKAN